MVPVGTNRYHLVHADSLNAKGAIGALGVGARLSGCAFRLDVFAWLV